MRPFPVPHRGNMVASDAHCRTAFETRSFAPECPERKQSNGGVLNQATLRRLDRFVALPLCIVPTIARRAAGLFRKRQRRTAASPGSIVFIKMTEQGASVLMCGAVRCAIEIAGRENVYFWVLEENRLILDMYPRSAE